MELKEKLSSLREEKNWTQEELAEILEVSRQAVSKWEKGTAIPSSRHLYKLCEIFGTSLDGLVEVGKTEEPEPVTEGRPARKKIPKKFLIWLALTACVYGAILIWGMAAKSPLMAWTFLDFLTFLQLLGWFIYGMYFIAMQLKKEKEK